MSAPIECPKLESWQALLDDLASADERKRYEQHLECCAVCQHQLDRAEDAGDDLLQLARRLGDPTAAPTDPTLVQVLGRLHDKRPDSETAHNPADLYFLAPSDQPDVLGTLGDYEVHELIGQGGMGVVLKAFEPALHRLVAIKVMSPALAGSPIARQRFTREAQAAAAVCHDHIVTVHGVDEKDSLPYLVMQYVAGESLQERLDRSGPLELTEIVRIALQTASGLAAAHAQGLIHRDIKPANLLLENGLARVKITDFGLARMVDDVPMTQHGVVAGTPEYMAPEQARGETIDHRADLFSLGSVIYAMCTGVPPFRGSTAVSVLRRVSDEAPVPIRSLNPNVPAWLETLVAGLLAKNPADRFQSAGELATLLESYLAHLQQPATVTAPQLPTSPLTAQAARQQRRQRLLLLGLLAIALAELGLMLWLTQGAAQPAIKPDKFQEYYHSFKADRELPIDFEWDGLEPAECVQFEPSGMRVMLPTGHAGRRMGTGIILKLPVKGDFEITMSFEVLKEPNLADAENGTGGYLWVDLDEPTMNRAMIFRSIALRSAVPMKAFSNWFYLSDPKTGKRLADGGKAFPTSRMKGRLRLVRNGSTLSYYAGDESGDELTLLDQHAFSTQDLNAVRIGGITGGPKASLDFLITDLSVRAESLPNMPGPPELPEERGWLLIGTALALAILLGLGAWLYRRQSRVAIGRSRRQPAMPAESTTPSIFFPCSGCGKRLKAAPDLAGKKVKCPTCAEAVRVPTTARP